MNDLRASLVHTLTLVHILSSLYCLLIIISCPLFRFQKRLICDWIRLADVNTVLVFVVKNHSICYVKVLTTVKASLFDDLCICEYLLIE